MIPLFIGSSQPVYENPSRSIKTPGPEPHQIDDTLFQAVKSLESIAGIKKTQRA